MASEVGVLDIAPENVLFKGRLQPGRMFLVDTQEGRIVSDEEIKQRIVTERPYRQWLDANLLKLSELAEGERLAEADHQTMIQRQLAFGYTFEDLRILMAPMAKQAVEAIGSMGTDTPLAVLSGKPQPLYNYFQQLFAQVTNPPIDSIREEIVTSAVTTLGTEGNVLEPTPQSCHQIELPTPILTNGGVGKAAAHRPARLQVRHPAHAVPVRRRRAGAGAGDGRVVRAGRSGDQERQQYFDPVRPGRRQGAGADPGAAGMRGPAPPPHPGRDAHPRRPRAGNGRAA